MTDSVFMLHSATDKCRLHYNYVSQLRVLTIKVEHHVVDNIIQWRIAETIYGKFKGISEPVFRGSGAPKAVVFLILVNNFEFFFSGLQTIDRQ